MSYIKEKVTAVLCAAVFVALVFTLNTAYASAAVDDHTVAGKTPQGTVVSLFDYWVKKRTSPDHGKQNEDSGGGINKSHSLKFSNGGGSGFNGWTGSSSPYSGMVSKTLDSNGYPSLATNFSSGIFYPESLGYLFDNTSAEGKKAYNDIDGLMQVDDEGYYYYDCMKNYASFDEKTNSMKLYDKPAVMASSSGKTGQFFPFDSASKVFTESNGQLASSNISAGSNNVNHWFGLSMSTHFLHPEEGKTTRGKDITYEFSGDDDVWVFIDDVLVGDLGGIHDAASLKINFSTGAVSINGSSDGTIKSKYEAAGKTSETEWKGNTFAGGTYHTLKFFYLERGNYESNMSLKFNLKLMPDNEIQKVDQYSNALQGAQFEMYEADRKETDGEIEYTQKGSSLCTGTTDVNGSLILKSSDGATINCEELYKKNIGPYYILKETKAPEGYRKAKDVWLEYDPKTGALTTENMWQSGIYANPRIMITAPTYIYDRQGNQLEMNDDGSLKQGSVFAVVYKRNDMDGSISDDSNWSAISGSVLDGWRKHKVDTIEDVLDGNKYELKLNSMGAYETTLSELPGDIMTYSNVIVADNAGKSDSEVLSALTDKAKYSISYYYTTGDVDDATSANTVRLDTGIMTRNSKVRPFEYKYAAKFVATDVSNDLYVRKFDKNAENFEDTEHTVNGVTFALYAEDQTTLLSRLLPGDPVLKSDAVPVQEQTTKNIDSQYGSKDLTGTAVFRKISNGKYYLKEISAPSGYKINDKMIKVVVNDNGAFANAGEKGDGIYVGRSGSGTLLKSMEQFATNDDIDSTLTNMKLNLVVSDEEPSEDGSISDHDTDTIEDTLHIRYTALGEASKVGRYKVLMEDGTYADFLKHIEFFATDTGWPRISLKQCMEHNSGNDKSSKTDLGDMELSQLMVLESMVMVTDDTVGDLRISKKVINDKTDSTFDDEKFDFDISLYETVTDDDGRETKKPVTGEYRYTIKGAGTDDEQTVTFDKDGKATVSLKDGQAIVIKDLPASAKYEVTEDTASYWKVSSSKDGAGYTDSSTVKGSIPEPDKDGNKQQSSASYQNTYEPASASVKLSAEKKFNAWNDEGLQTEFFDIRLTAVENTGSGDINDTMTEKNHMYDEVIEQDDEGRMIDTLTIKKNGSDADKDGYIHSSKDFQELKFTHSGTYIYTVKEILGDLSGIRYSDAVYDVVVTVTDDGRGSLSASYKMTGETDDDGVKIPPSDRSTYEKAVFTNTYSNRYGYADLRIHKSYHNETGSDALIQDQFRFKLEAVGENKDKAPMPGDTTDRSVTEGNTIGGSVSFPTFVFQTKDAGNKYVYRLTEAMPDGASVENGYTVNGTKYDPQEYFIRISVTSNGSETLETQMEYFEDEACTKPIKEGSDHLYEIEDGVFRLLFSNSYEAAPAEAVIEGSKILNGRDMKEGEFTFQLAAADDDTKAAIKDGSVTTGSLETSSSAAAASTESGFSFDKLKFTKTGTYRFEVTEKIPSDAENRVKDGVTYDRNVCTVTVKVTDKDSDGIKTGKLAASVSYSNTRHADVTDRAAFGNTYKESGSASISGSKKITGRDFAKGDSFTFTVTPEDGAPYPVDKDGSEVKEVTVAPESGSKADIDFGTVKFDKAGSTYRYTLREKQPASGEDAKGVTYDSTVYEVTLSSKANDPQDGTLTIEKTVKAGSETADSITWTNGYKASGNLALEGSKTLTGRKWKDSDSFTFTLWAKADDKTLLDALDKEKTTYSTEDGKAVFGTVTVTGKDAAGKAKAALDFGKLHFVKDSEGKPFEFFITETVPGSDTKGITYDSKDHRIPVYVTDDGSGKLTAEVAENSITNLDFENRYSTSVEYSANTDVEISKTLSGRDMTDGQFEFTVKALDNETGGTTAAQAAGILGFSRDDTEKVFSSSAAADGEESLQSILDGRSVKFTNENAGKTYSYEVSETKGGDEKGGYTNDDNVYLLDIAVEDDGDSVLTVTTTVKNKNTGKIADKSVMKSSDKDTAKTAVKIPFANKYSASGSLDASGTAGIKAEKTLTGRDMKAGEYSFKVVNTSDPEKKILSTGTNEVASAGKPGSIEFNSIEYTSAQLKKDVSAGLATKDGDVYTLQYEVYEVTDSLPAGVSPVKSSFTITVHVKDDGKGRLEASVTYPDKAESLQFENAYDTSSTVIPLKGLKVLEKSDESLATDISDIAGKFSFSIEGVETTGTDQKKAPVPQLDGKDTEKVSSDASGNVDFGSITLQASDFEDIQPDDHGIRKRTFRYTVTESGSAAGVTNDKENTKTIEISVKYSSKEKSFDVEGLSEGPAFTFTNTYSAEEKTVDADTLFKVSKVLKGRDLNDGEFSFQLIELTGNGEMKVVAEGGNKAAAAGSKAEVSFGKISYSGPGEHDYIIREVVPSKDKAENVSYDTAVHDIHVSVTDSKDGTLKVISSESGDKPIVFTNKYSKPEKPGKLEKPSKPGGNGSTGGSRTKTGDDTPLGMIIALMLTAACAAAVVLISRRKQRR